MTRTIKAVFEGGVLRPLEVLDGIADRARVTVTIVSDDSGSRRLASHVGTLPDEDAAEMIKIIEGEFEKVDHSEW